MFKRYLVSKVYAVSSLGVVCFSDNLRPGVGGGPSQSTPDVIVHSGILHMHTLGIDHHVCF